MAGADKEACTCENFLKKNKVKEGWQNLILQNSNLKDELTKILHGELKDEEKNKSLRPDYDKILNAFSHAEPGDIKVVIIGTSPAATNSIANGLAFSSDRYESTLGTGRAIPKVHEALRKAEIVMPGPDYHCGHQKWVENGVLLLNAALTIRDARKEDAQVIDYHCKLWLVFLKGLLSEWIGKTQLNHKLFVMRWGDRAESVWSEIKKPNIHAFPVIHHPTFPKPIYGNNFLENAPDHFKTISETHENVFDLESFEDRQGVVDNVREKMENLTLKTF